MDRLNYNVEFEPFTERHYIKKFQKEYKGQWLRTKQAIIDVCARIDNMLLYNRADLITSNGGKQLVKLDFAVAGTNVSPKASGNRCILFVDNDVRLVRILLVYSKDEISEPNETQKWKGVIKREYEDVGELFGL